MNIARWYLSGERMLKRLSALLDSCTGTADLRHPQGQNTTGFMAAFLLGMLCILE